MNRNAFESLDRETLLGVAVAQAEAIERLIAKVANLEAEVARLQAKQDRPPKTPNNSSIPPSQGHKKTTEFVKSRRKKKPHPGAHRPLHPNPTHRRDVLASTCEHCGADVSGAPQAPCADYDRIEIPPIAPEITRVSLHGGVCPCCARRFKAEAPEGLEPGSPFGSNLRAFVIYLRFTQGVAFERLSRLMKDLFDLDVSESALVNILSAAREPFAAASAVIRDRLLNGSVICSDETGLRVGKRSWWLWVFHHKQNAFFLTHPGRSKEAVEEFLGDISPRHLGFRSLRRPGRLGRERPPSLPRPSPTRYAIRHRRGRRRLLARPAPFHRRGLRGSRAARHMERRHAQNPQKTPRSPA